MQIDQEMPTVEGVILAAGLSTRSGRYKMALPLGNKAVIQRSVESMYGTVDRIWIVTGWQADQVRALLVPYAKVKCVFNAAFRQGMFSSIQAGLARVSAPRAFLLPGDCALVHPDTYIHMLSIQADVVIPTYRGRKGHPVLFDRQAIGEILALPGDAILRAYIRAKGFTAMEVEDDGILLDLDTPEDYETMRARCCR